MEVGVQVLRGVNSHITDIFLNVGLARKGEAETIEDENQEHQNNKIDVLKRQGHLALPYLCPELVSSAMKM